MNGTRVLIEVEGEGVIEAELDGRAPESVANFLHYVDAGCYAGGRFYRTVREDNQPTSAVKISVIQGGVDPDRVLEEEEEESEGKFRKKAPVPLERTNATGLQHLDGTLSMARTTPDTATTEFFVCVGDQPELDFGGKRNPDGQGFAAFGRVVHGMELVRKIHQAEAEGQQLTLPFAFSIRRREGLT